MEKYLVSVVPLFCSHRNFHDFSEPGRKSFLLLFAQKGMTFAVSRVCVYKRTTPSCTRNPALGVKIPSTCLCPVMDVHSFFLLKSSEIETLLTPVPCSHSIHFSCLVVENSAKLFPIKQETMETLTEVTKC